MIAAGRVVLGLVARAASWQVSAISHVGLDMLATAFFLLSVPLCLDPQPAPRPELAAAIERGAGLLNQPEPQRMHVFFFAPENLARFPDTGGFLKRVHDQAGSCRYEYIARLDGEYTAVSLLACEKRRVVMSIGLAGC